MGGHVLPDGAQEALALAADSAAQQDSLGGQGVHQIGHACGNVLAVPVDDGLGRGVAPVGGIEDGAPGDILRRRVGQQGLRVLQGSPSRLANQGGGGGIGLPAARRPQVQLSPSSTSRVWPSSAPAERMPA